MEMFWKLLYACLVLVIIWKLGEWLVGVNVRQLGESLVGVIVFKLGECLVEQWVVDQIVPLIESIVCQARDLLVVAIPQLARCQARDLFFLAGLLVLTALFFEAIVQHQPGLEGDMLRDSEDTLRHCAEEPTVAMAEKIKEGPVLGTCSIF